MPADKLRKIGPPPPPVPNFDWGDRYKPGRAELIMDLVMPAVLIGMCCVMALLFLGLGLPKLLVAAHAAWLEVFRVWGTQ